MPISALQQQSPAVGTALALIKLGNDWLAKIPGNNKHQVVLLSDIKEAFFVAQTLSSQHVCNRGGFFCLQISSPSRIMRASFARTAHIDITWGMGFDLYPLQTMESRRQYYAQAILGELADSFTHDPAIP